MDGTDRCVEHVRVEQPLGGATPRPAPHDREFWTEERQAQERKQERFRAMFRQAHGLDQ